MELWTDSDAVGVEWLLLKGGDERGKGGFMFLMLANAGCGEGIGGVCENCRLLKLLLLKLLLLESI